MTNVRLVVGDAEPHAQGAAPLSLRDLPYADGGSPAASHDGGGASGAPRSRPPFTASSTWPPRTQKYAALVLEPSRRAAGEENTDPACGRQPRHPLRHLADTATHQSLLRCRGRSALTDMNCDADPTYLGAPYLRVMLSAFLLLPSMVGSATNTSQPLRVAVLGVAGGSLPGFLQHFFSSAIKVMDLVDVEPQCFRAAVEQLGWGKWAAPSLWVASGTGGGGEEGSEVAGTGSGTHVRVHVSDAAVFLRESQRQRFRGAEHGQPVGVAPTPPSSSTSNSTTPLFPPQAAHLPSARTRGKLTRPYDVLFVDLFVGSEIAAEVGSLHFLQLCRQSLTSVGVAAFNLPVRADSFVSACERVFGSSNVYTIPTPGSSNIVVLARGGGEEGDGISTSLPHLSHRVLCRRARQLQQRYKLPYDLANHYPLWWHFW